MKPLRSEQMSRASSRSFSGSLSRIWPMFSRPDSSWWVRALLGAVGMWVMFGVWGFLAMGYLVTLMVSPLGLVGSRLVGRHRRYRKLEAQRHREVVEALQGRPGTLR